MNDLLRDFSHALLVLAGILLVMPVLPLVPAQAQTVDGQFLTQINSGAGTGGLDQLQVSVELAASPTFDLGSSTLMFTFNDAALAIPSNPSVNDQLVDGTDFQFEDPFIGDPGSGKFYGPSTVTVFGQANRLAVNLVLEVTNFGQPLSETFTPVVTLFFDITDPAQTADLSWILPSLEDPNPTEILLEDNLTLVTLGTFSNDNTLLPVELVAFEAKLDGEAVVLHWETASETNNAGFEVERQVEETSALWEQIGFVEGRGTTIEPQVYQYMDQGLPFEAAVLRYRLKQVDFDGTFEYSPEVKVSVGLPERVVLHANYPDPFNLQTVILYEMPVAQRVRLTVYDALGRQVAVLVDGEQEAGRHRVTFAGYHLPGGMYFYRLEAGAQVTVRTMLLLK